MHQITAQEFQDAVHLDPAWASNLTEPVEITEYCLMEASHITHLSPLLHFTGRSANGYSANFMECANLKVAEGTFHGFVSFYKSNIEKIGKLSVTQPDEEGYACDFDGCESLKVAEGTFVGHVMFQSSGIEKIGKLYISPANQKNGKAASFIDCVHLTLPKAWLERTDILTDEELKYRSEIQIQHEAIARKAIKQPSFEL